MTINQILKISVEKLKSKNISSADLDAEVLLLEALNRHKRNINKSWLYVNNNYELNEKEEKLFNNFIKQRLKYKPVAYIADKKEFYGYEFYTDENVLIPRPETELMVEEVLKIIENSDGRLGSLRSPVNLVDIGTGSGCIIISILNELKKRKKDIFINNAYANDISVKAIKVAKLNAKKYNLNKEIKFITGDFGKFMKKSAFLFSGNFIITANLPYIKKNEYKKLSPNVKKYEPKTALVGGVGGLELIEKLINSISNIKIKNNLKNKSNSSGHILLEADPAQMKKIKLILKNKLYVIDIKITKDLRGKNRLISAEI